MWTHHQHVPVVPSVFGEQPYPIGRTVYSLTDQHLYYATGTEWRRVMTSDAQPPTPPTPPTIELTTTGSNPELVTSFTIEPYSALMVSIGAMSLDLEAGQPHYREFKNLYHRQDGDIQTGSTADRLDLGDSLSRLYLESSGHQVQLFVQGGPNETRRWQIRITTLKIS